MRVVAELEAHRGRARLAHSALLSLYAGPDLLWQRTVEQFQSIQGARAIEGGHQKDAKAVELLLLVPLAPGTEVIEVVTCDERVAQLPVDKLKEGTRRFYAAPNRRGKFKLVEFSDGMEQTALRDISHIILKPGGGARAGEESRRP